MNNDNAQTNGEHPPNLSEEGIVNHTKKQRYHQAVRESESKEAEFNARLDVRKQGVEEIRQRHLTLLDAQQNEYQSERTQIKQNLDEAKINREAALRSASEHCSEVAVCYVAGKTTGMDILNVPLLEDAEAAKRLGLPFGVGFSDKVTKFLKPVLMVLCWFMSALSLGLAFRLLNAKNLFASPTMVGLSIVIGGVVAVGLFVALTKMYLPIGTKIGSGRPTKEVIGLLIPVLILTLALLLGLACLDAKAIILLNAARAALNPAFEISMGVALLMGMVISGVYVLGLAGGAFADGYNDAARESIMAEIMRDKNVKQDEAKQKVPIRAALEALGNVKVADEIIQNLNDDLKHLDQEFKRERAEVLASLPQVPTTLEPDERKELTDLRDRTRSARAHQDAHIVSRNSTTTSNINQENQS